MPYALANVGLSPIFRWAKGEVLYISKQNLLFWGAYMVSFSVMGQSNWLVAKK